MWRAFFLAIGITLCIVGAECLGLERIVLKLHDSAPAVQQADPFNPLTAAPGTGPGARRVITVYPHTPFSLMGLGAVVMLYAYDLPRRMNGG
jgi:hypothetical protein